MTVAIWEIDLDPVPPLVSALDALLSTDERVRANRLIRQRDQRRFTVARGALRTLLAGVLGVADPAAIRFDYAAKGKPSLAPGQTRRDIRFNLAHSGELALLAVTEAREVGVDLECVRPEVEILALAQRFFSPAEAARLKALPPPEQLTAFFDCWARKESYIKARGEGLSLALGRFEVGFGPGQDAELRVDRGDALARSRWHLVEIGTRPGYRAALTVEGEPGTIHRHRFETDIHALTEG
jgi:4'-phosphopantetheinyl transferase